MSQRDDFNGSVPYFSQWESAALISQIIAGEVSAADDPLWASSGAASAEEYAKWARHLCGMACLKMIVAARTGRLIPTLELAKLGLRHGAYTERGEEIVGMIYAPFVAFIRKEFAIESRVVTGITAADIPTLLAESEFFIASVHPSIREPQREPPTKGGHLILATEAGNDSITFHNPSGFGPETQASVTLSVDTFGRFFAGRGVAVLGTGRRDTR